MPDIEKKLNVAYVMVSSRDALNCTGTLFVKKAMEMYKRWQGYTFRDMMSSYVCGWYYDVEYDYPLPGDRVFPGHPHSGAVRNDYSHLFQP